MLQAVIENNIVINTIVADEAFVSILQSEGYRVVPYNESDEDDTKVARIGEAYIDGKFIGGNQAVELGYMSVDEAKSYGFHSGQEYVEPEVVEITEISMKQARLYLYRVGLLSQVEAFVDTDMEAKIAWEYSNTVSKNDYLVTSLASTLGLTEEALTSMFEEASKI